MSMDQLLEKMVETNASDLYIKTGSPPMYRIEGNTLPTKMDVLTPQDTEQLAYSIMTDEQKREFEREKELNFAYHLPGVRFRVNVYRQRESVAIVFRQIKLHIATIDDLSLPPIFKEIALTPRGLVIVSGATGSGKSTTLAAIIDYRNENKTGHIITIEDPIEFIHLDKKGVVSQREVGIDTYSFGNALKNTLRQAPEVILIGEMRDTETVSSAIYYAETGHLVLSTLHATNANQTMERLINFFPEEMHAQIYLNLSLNLKAVISQRLIPGIDKKRVAAIEVMIVTPRVKELIRRGQIGGELKSTIESSRNEGCQSFDQTIYELYQEGKISQEDALRHADSPNDMRLKMKGLA
ncbi:TPA: type IV pili twitching motility protein PilT [bacterium]|nr:type IV pili twitching motility protein PilT [bacterium]